MKIGYCAASAVALLWLAGCGGGSGGVETTPTPAPSPTPTPTPAGNTTMTDLKVSQAFTNDAATLRGTWDLATGTAIEGTSKPASLSIRYDAAAGSYALVTDARNQSFGGADVTSQDAYDTVYRRSDGTSGETLTLVKQPYTGQTARQYVAMGFWQSSTVADGRQSTEFTSFTYGLPTAATAVPRSGAAAYGIDMFGLVTMPGEEPMSMQGSGKLSVDFTQGVFTAQAYSSEHGLVTDKGVSGGGMELRAGGNLSSGSGTVSGSAVYGSIYGQASGTISGRFYGPGGEELGATFQTANAQGMAAVGSLVGWRDPSLKPDAQTLAALVSGQEASGLGGTGGSSVRWLNSETFDFQGYSSDMVGGRFTINEKIASRNPNFTTYAKTGDNGYGPLKVTLELYKPGSANTELALTYSSFGHWTGAGAGALTQSSYFTYGFVTGSNFLAARTGTGRYEGVAYGSGIGSAGATRYDVKGTSSLDVDFGAQTFGGTLALTGTEQTSGARADFGSYDMAGQMTARDSGLQGGISRGGNPLGSLTARFFGADAQELAGTYYVNASTVGGTPENVGISGAIVTVRK